MGRYGRRILAVLLALLAGVTVGSCGSRRTASVSALPAVAAVAHAPAAGVAVPDLVQILKAELARLGVDITRTTAAAPAGKDNEVFDLAARIVDPTWPNFEYPVEIELSWTERLAGDYNQDGLVTVNDLTPLSQFWQQQVHFDDPADHGGLTFWPSGDPDEAGSDNWRLARVDGNSDSLVTVNDITPIAQHWQQRLSGYQVYMQPPGTDAAELVPNSEKGDDLQTVPRQAAFPAGSTSPDSTKPVRYRFKLEAAEEGQYLFFVRPFDSQTGVSGPTSNAVQLDVSSNLAPVADLSAEPEAGIPPLAVSFDASNSIDPDGTIESYDWDWNGDGEYELSGGSTPTAIHTFDERGVFNATVKVTDDRGAAATASVAIRVNQLPVAVLNATPKVGLTPLTVDFDASDSVDPDGAIASYEWDWESDGDYDEDTGTTPVNTHSFTVEAEHTVTVRVTDTDGESAAASTTIKVNQPPTVNLQASPSSGASPLDVSFYCSAIQDPDGLIVLWEWDWEGDGEVDYAASVLTSVEHRYEESGEFDAHLTITDNDGATSTYTATIRVDPAPSANLSIHPGIGPAPLWVSLIAQGHDGYNEIAKYEWDFEGDGVFDMDSGLIEWASHEYQTGTYNPTVRITNDKGVYGTDSEPLEVETDDGLPRWHTVNPVGDAFIGTVSMIMADGRPAIAYTEGHAEDPVMYARAIDERGLYWNPPVEIAALSDDNGRGSESISMALINNRPAVCYRRENKETNQLELTFCQAADSYGEEWQEPLVVAARSENNCSFFSLAEVNNRPAVSYSFWDIDALYFRQAQDPSGAAWGDERLVATLAYDPWDQSMLVVDGRPAIAFDGPPFCYVRANDVDGTSWPAYRILDYEGGGYPSMAIVDGNPAIAHYRWGPFEGPGKDLKYIRALDAQGTTWGPSVTLVNSADDDDLGRYSSLAVVDGHPMIAYWHKLNAMYIRSSDTTGSSWDTPQQFPFTYSFCDNPLIVTSEGLPAVCYGEEPVYAVYF